uniref:Selenoprotein P n=1 Tax=Tetraodon nigroviridis TaxID=99883 RepID=H3DGX7_TETNG
MRACLGLLLTLCMLHGGGAESDGDGPRCQLPPTWKIGDLEPMTGAMGRVTVVALLDARSTIDFLNLGRMDSLRQKLENQGLRDVVYMVVNHQGAQARGLHAMLAQRLSEHISLHRQDEALADVWQTLGGNKDDFFIYDRCGRLTHRISLPYAVIGHGHVEKAVKDTYCSSLCGECTHETAETQQECTPKTDTQPQEDTRHECHHRHHQGHQHHGDGHRDHGDNQCTHTQGSGPGHDHGHGHHGGQGHHQGHDQAGGVAQRPDHLELGQAQQVVSFHHHQHDAAAAKP